jgi:dihydroorotate dehydrogenase electron transfer subunit
VGEATEAIHGLKVGQALGLRGPYGNYFTLVEGRALLVAGGMGIASLLPLANSLKGHGTKVELVYGARTATELCGLRQARGVADSLQVATDDGSYGTKGLVTTLLPPLLEKGYDMVYCCGPEPMMKEVFTLTEKYGLPLQASMERIIKCSLGLCGSCMIGKYRVCKDGLVLTSEQLRAVANEFGVYKRGFDGRRTPF